MNKAIHIIIALVVSLLAASQTYGADWPRTLFAPYIYAKQGALIGAYNATGQKYFTLAFTTASGRNRRRSAASGPSTAPANPSFSGHPMSDHFLAEDIAFIRSKGGDVIMSFGGADGTELGVTDPDPAKVEAKYQAVIDEYKLTWIDMDIEGRSIHDPAANHVRNTALVNLQKKNPGLIVVYTLAADPNGIEPHGLATLRDAHEQGLRVEAVNLMAMDYGREMSAGKKMADLAIATVHSSYNQMQKIDPAMKIGITPDIGINDEPTEIFGLDDARAVMAWARDKAYVRLLAFWVLQRDRAGGQLSQDTASGIRQNDWEFNSIFSTFTTGFISPVTAPAKPRAADDKPPFHVLVMAENGGVHAPFVAAAKVWLADLAGKENFTLDYIENADKINDEFLSHYQLFLQLNFPPYTWSDTAKEAFRKYITEGRGGWVGLHHASLIGEFDGYHVWPWYQQFMGGITWKDYIPKFASGKVNVEDKDHPVMKGIPASFVIKKEEWYTYDKSPRPNVHVIASVDESSYVPDGKVKMGDHPVIWTNDNVKARNIYIFMGHSPVLFDDDAYKAILKNSILWAGGRNP